MLKKQNLYLSGCVLLLLALGACGGPATDKKYVYDNPYDTTPPPSGGTSSVGTVVIAYVDPVNEKAVLVNQTTSPVDMTGWTLSSKTLTFTFPTTTLLAGHFLRVNTGTGTNTATDFYWSGTNNWDNAADTPVLKNATGVIVASCTYSATSTPSYYLTC